MDLQEEAKEIEAVAETGLLKYKREKNRKTEKKDPINLQGKENQCPIQVNQESITPDWVRTQIREYDIKAERKEAEKT